MPKPVRGIDAAGGQLAEHRAGATALRAPLDEFGAQALREEAARQGVAVEELAAYAVSYYLGDRDSGRVTQRPPPLP